jgi:hypothetical protein
MAKAIADLDLSDSEVMQFAFQITAEKLAVLGWNIETTAKEDGKSDEKVKPQAEQAAKQAAPLLHHQLMRPQASTLIKVLTWPLSLPRLLLDSAIAWNLTITVAAMISPMVVMR